jgi:hypothetical protein
MDVDPRSGFHARSSRTEAAIMWTRYGNLPALFLSTTGTRGPRTTSRRMIDQRSNTSGSLMMMRRIDTGLNLGLSSLSRVLVGHEKGLLDFHLKSNVLSVRRSSSVI